MVGQVLHRLVAALERGVEPRDPVTAEPVLTHVPDVTEFARGPEPVDQGFHLEVPGIVTLHVRDHEPLAALALGGQDPLGLLDGDRHRLLHEHVLARQKEVTCDLALPDEVARHHHGPDRGIGRQLPVIVVQLGDMELPLDSRPQVGPDFRDGGQLDLGQRGQVGEMHALGQVARAHVSELQRLHGHIR